MEFPDTGKRCSIEDCKQLDFLAVTCDHCQNAFCKDHFNATRHECSQCSENVIFTKNKSSSYLCSMESCTETFPIEMQCIKCKKHYCIQHRYHGCIEMTEDKKPTKLKKWQISKKQFAEAKAAIDQEVSNTLKKSKNTAMANKVRLMRIKGSAIGPKNVPVNERSFFLVYPPLGTTNKHIKPSKAVYVNMNWTVGKAIDSVADTLKVTNKNNTTDTCKLQIFDHTTGNLICGEMDTLLTNLLETSVLVDGQGIILEYSNDESVDVSLYK